MFISLRKATLKFWINVWVERVVIYSLESYWWELEPRKNGFHTAFLGGRYPYELQQRKGSYFPFLWCIVVRKQALVLLKTYGLKRYSLLNIWKLALFDQYSPGAFLSNWSSNCWIILIKTIKGNHKHSFETICIDVWAF